MKLTPENFELVKAGKKRLEFRLFDEKRKAFQVGERIELAKLPELDTSVIVEITSLDVYADLPTAYAAKAADLPETTYADFSEHLLSFYSESEIAKYGVVAIGIILM